MVLASKKGSLYDFTIDIFLMKQAISGDKYLSKVYNNAISEIKGILNEEMTFYDIDSRTFDIVSLATMKYKNVFKEPANPKNNLTNLLKVLEENNKKNKFENSFH